MCRKLRYFFISRFLFLSFSVASVSSSLFFVVKSIIVVCFTGSRLTLTYMMHRNFRSEYLCCQFLFYLLYFGKSFAYEYKWEMTYKVKRDTNHKLPFLGQDLKSHRKAKLLLVTDSWLRFTCDSNENESFLRNFYVLLIKLSSIVTSSYDIAYMTIFY